MFTYSKFCNVVLLSAFVNSEHVFAEIVEVSEQNPDFSYLRLLQKLVQSSRKNKKCEISTHKSKEARVILVEIGFCIFFLLILLARPRTEGERSFPEIVKYLISRCGSTFYLDI